MLFVFDTREEGGTDLRRGYSKCMTPVEQSEVSQDPIVISLINWMLSLTPAQRLEVAEWHTNLMLNAPGLNCGAD
jgi:hypothetical protein